MSKLLRMCAAVALAGSVMTSLLAQQPPGRPRGVPKPPDPGPLFFSEHWRNPKTYKADALPLTSVTLDEDTWVAISGYGPTKATVIDGGELFGKSR